jgi:hypothetical protein
MITFVQACLNGTAHPSEIDDWIDAWHSNPETHGISLSEHLGFTLADYSLWMIQDLTVEDIIHSHRRKGPTEDDVYLQDDLFEI